MSISVLLTYGAALWTRLHLPGHGTLVIETDQLMRHDSFPVMEDKRAVVALVEQVELVVEFGGGFLFVVLAEDDLDRGVVHIVSIVISYRIGLKLVAIRAVIKVVIMVKQYKSNKAAWIMMLNLSLLLNVISGILLVRRGPSQQFSRGWPS